MFRVLRAIVGKLGGLGVSARRQAFRVGSIATMAAVLLSSAAPLAPWIATAQAASQAAKPTAEKVKPLESAKPTQQLLAPGAGASAQDVPMSDGSLRNPSVAADASQPRARDHEDISLRTATSKTWVNTDGSKTTSFSVEPQHYKKDGKWEDLSPKTTEDTAYRSKQALENESILGKLNPFANKTQALTDATGDLTAKLRPYGDGLELTIADKTFTVVPVGSANVRPISADRNGHQVVTYVDAWPGVDVDYEINGASLKETIILKKPGTQSDFVFQLKGIGAKANPRAESDKSLMGSLALDGIDPATFFIAPLSVNVNGRGIISDSADVAKQYTNGNVIVTSIDADWLKAQPKSAFPISVDPNFYHDVGGTYGNFVAYKSDGYVCYNTCGDPQAGTLYDNGWKSWRTAFRVPFDEMNNGLPKKVLGASMHLVKKQRSYWTGYDGWHYIDTSWAPCAGFGCVDGGSYTHGAGANTNDWSDVTHTLDWMVAGKGSGNSNPQWGGWFMMIGDENSESYKQFEPNSLGISFTWDDLTPVATPRVPADKQVVVQTQPSLQVNPVSDPNGDQVQYYFRVSTSPDGETGAVINSGWSTSAQWTVPEGVLQDGTTYYWHTYTWDGIGGAPSTAPDWVRSFKIDLRTGKDSTQAYDAVGPMSADLATGNVTTSIASHSISALGGSVGVNLDYNSPVRSAKGLTGEYFNNTTFSGTPALTRTDPTIDFDWLSGTPAAGIGTDNFSVRWKGYFIAPVTGSYSFGAVADDNVTIIANGQTVVNSGCCMNGYGNVPLNLTAGQVIPIEYRFVEIGGYATAHMYVRSPQLSPTDQPVPTDWLRTEPKITAITNGLAGRYYTDDSSHNFPGNEADPNRFLMARTDSGLSFTWGSGGVYSGAPVDNFMVRWRGYLIVPATGSYTFGAWADDGYRVKLGLTSGTADTTVFDRWTDQGGVFWPGTNGANGTPVTLTANTPYPITIEYFEHGGIAYAAPLIKGPGLLPDGQDVPSTWFIPSANVLPNGWNLGVDPDGNVGYERLRQTQASVILTDSTGATHEYTSSNGGYKPPVNEDGVLTRNSDGTFKLVDTDGRIYVFSTEGVLVSLTTPQDDKQPASLKYEYAGSPAHLTKISDGADQSRFGQAWYAGDSQCVTPSGFDPAPAGMLCAFTTTDGSKTSFLYKNYRLVRVEKPGSEITDFAYDGIGRITAVRDATAADAVAATVRADDDTTKSQLTYDAVGRVSGVTLPAPSVGAVRQQKTYEYAPGNNAAWTEPEQLPGDTPTGSPTLVNWGGSKIAAFARFGASELKYRFYENGNWTDWISLGTCMRDDPGAASWSDGRIDVFIRGCDDQLYTRTYLNGTWSAFGGLGGTSITSSPSATSWSQNRYDIFARGPSNELLHRWWAPSTGWSAFESLGGCISQAPTGSSWGIDRLNIYVQGCGSPTSFFSKYWAPGWIDFAVLTGEQNISSAIQSVSSPDQKIQVVARGASGDLRYLRYNGLAWDSWQTTQPCITGSPAITQNVDQTTVVYKGCDGKLYQTKRLPLAGTTKMHITGSSEPNGSDEQVDYDSLYRTLRNTDKTGLATISEWDPVKDLQYSTTDASGLKSSTIYDTDDRATDSYGPAPKAWFGADHKPQATYANQVPHTQTNYDENISGPAVAYYNFKAANKTLVGAPKLHTTGIDPNDARYFSRAWNSAIPITPDAGMDGWGLSATGKLTVPAAGNYTFRVWHDDGARLYVNDQLVIDDWVTGPNHSKDGNLTLEANKPYRFKLDYFDADKANATLDFSMHLGGGPVVGDNFFNGAITLKPDYNLTTSSKVFDIQTGDVVNKTNYGNQPELAQAQSTVENYISGGTAPDQNLTTAMAYEPYAPGSLMRQTSKTLPGGNTTNYLYYGATEAKANPCVVDSPTISQAGMAKGKSEPDPDNNPATTDKPGINAPRTSETVYDAAGRVVATRYNSDAWTCTAYDARGRILTTVIPAVNGRAGRTLTNNYQVNGNPLVVSTTDPSGTIYTTTDLLGRTTSYTDAQGNTTTSTYDDQGHLTDRSGPLGAENFTYDQYDRLTDQKLDSITYAHVSYDAYSRIDNVTYPAAGQEKVQYARDQLGRLSGLTYTKGDGTAGPSDQVTRSVTGDILSGTENGMAKSYAYDNAGRLTGATIGSNTFSYSYSAPTTSQCSQASANLNTHKNSNRTASTVNGATTTFCYNYADQLISSSDATLNAPSYDDHGNTIQLGGTTAAPATTTPISFSYDATDCNTGITQKDTTGNGFSATYTRDVQGRIISRQKDTLTSNGSGGSTSTTTNQTNYGFTGSGDTPDFTRDNAWNITEKYLQLPGNVLLTIRPSEADANKQKTYSLVNIHGDVFATANAVGAITGTTLTGPFGEQIAGQAKPDNAASTAGTSTSYQYVGQHEKLTETDFTVSLIQMGARVYIPSLGKFLQVDPVEGGGDNNYGYPVDPVNDFDLDGNVWGQGSVKNAWRATTRATKAGRQWTWKHREGIVAVAGITACVVGTAGACLGVAAVGAAIGGVAAGTAKYGQTRSIKKALFAGALSSSKDFAVGYVASKVAGAKYVARYFGKVGTTTRYYRSVKTAWKKAPVRNRAVRQTIGGVAGYAYQKWGW